MAIDIVDSFQGKPHVTADDVGGFKAGIVGEEDYMLQAGEQMKATLVSNNKIRIAEGESVMQGRHWRIKPNTYEDVTINNGTQGQKRKDAIVARYTKNSSSGIEKIELAVLQGTDTTETPVEPTPTKGDIRTGTLKHEMLLYIVELNGLNVVGVEPMFKVLKNMHEIDESLSDNVSELGEKYIKFANGLLMQWGSTNHGKYTTVVSNVVLPVPYKDADYLVQVTPGRNCTSLKKFWVGDVNGNSNKTKKGFNVGATYENVSYDKDLYWFTIGRWK